jgi:hypothetical protein
MSSNTQSSLSIHRGPIPVDIGLPEIGAFGVLKIKMNSVPMDTTPLFIQFTLDQSCSMVEGCGSKIKCLKETMLNILAIIVKHQMPIWVAIDGFDTIYHKIVPITQVTPDNLSELQDKVRAIKSEGSTNLKAAIKSSQASLAEAVDFKKKYNFFLTDGNATIGEMSNVKLFDLISGEYPTIFIGYGDDHNSWLLINGSKKHINSSYQLVLEYETVGVLCGELLNEICYPALNEVVITTSGQLDKIYNPTTNEWGHKVTLGYLVAEKEYTFLLSTCYPEFEPIHLSGVEPSTGNIDIVEMDFDENCYLENLSLNVFQQKINLLLREAVKKEHSVYHGLKTLFHTIHKYAREMEFLEDPAYLVMFEDIYIAYTKFYDTNSEMYTYSRLAANMRTQNYRSNSASSSQSQTQPADYLGGGLTRMASVTYSQNDSDDEEVEVSPIFLETVLEEAIMEEPEPDPKEQKEVSDEDIDSIEHYVPRSGIIDLNVTQTQFELSREASLGITRL